MTVPSMALVDGRPGTDWPVTDRGLHYGDGLFETISCVAGRPRWLAAHWRRLVRGCEVLSLPRPDLRQVEAEIVGLAAGSPACIVKLVYSRAGGARGYGYAPEQGAHRLLLRYDWAGPTATPARLCAALAEFRLGENAVLAGLKHLNRLEQVLAAAERQRRDLDEVLLQSASGQLICGSSSNVFLKLADRWVTPDLATAGIAGVMRAQVLQAATALRLACDSRPVPVEQLAHVEALFVTNVRLGLAPIRRLGQRELPLDASVPDMQDWINAHVG